MDISIDNIKQHLLHS